MLCLKSLLWWWYNQYWLVKLPFSNLFLNYIIIIGYYLHKMWSNYYIWALISAPTHQTKHFIRKSTYDVIINIQINANRRNPSYIPCVRCPWYWLGKCAIWRAPFFLGTALLLLVVYSHTFDYAFFYLTKWVCKAFWKLH